MSFKKNTEMLIMWSPIPLMILAGLFAVSFQMYSAEYKDRSAKNLIRSYYEAQKEYFNEYGEYSANNNHLGFDPSSKLEIVLNNDSIPGKLNVGFKLSFQPTSFEILIIESRDDLQSVYWKLDHHGAISKLESLE